MTEQCRIDFKLGVKAAAFSSCLTSPYTRRPTETTTVPERGRIFSIEKFLNLPLTRKWFSFASAISQRFPAVHITLKDNNFYLFYLSFIYFINLKFYYCLVAGPLHLAGTQIEFLHMFSPVRRCKQNNKKNDGSEWQFFIMIHSIVGNVIFLLSWQG